MTTSFTSPSPYGYPAPETSAPAAEVKRRPTKLIIVAAVAVALLIASAILAVMLVKSNSRADAAEAQSADRLGTIHSLEGDVTELKGQVTTLNGQLTAATDRANKAEGQVELWRRAGAGDAAFFNLVQQSAPAVALAGETSVIELGHAMCTALSRGSSDTAILGMNTYFPADQMRYVLTTAKAFVC